MSPFRLREPHHIDTLPVGAHRIKWYEMSADGEPLAPEVREAARGQIRTSLTGPGGCDLGRGGCDVGFVVLHHGAEAVWLLCDTWRTDILHHVLWRADLSRPTEFTRVEGGGPLACVHELEVIAHESRAYVRHVLAAESPDPDGYAADIYGQIDEQRRRALLAFDAAWRLGDVDALMGLMSEQPRYAASTGPGPGRVHEGTGAVRRAFAEVIHQEAAAGDQEPARALSAGEIWLDGDRALTPWQYSDRDRSGRPVVVHGVDVWQFAGSRLMSKDAYRKAWPTAD